MDVVKISMVYEYVSIIKRYYEDVYMKIPLWVALTPFEPPPKNAIHCLVVVNINDAFSVFFGSIVSKKIKGKIYHASLRARKEIERYVMSLMAESEITIEALNTIKTIENVDSYVQAMYFCRIWCIPELKISSQLVHTGKFLDHVRHELKVSRILDIISDTKIEPDDISSSNKLNFFVEALNQETIESIKQQRWVDVYVHPPKTSIRGSNTLDVLGDDADKYIISKTYNNKISDMTRVLQTSDYIAYFVDSHKRVICFCLVEKLSDTAINISLVALKEDNVNSNKLCYWLVNSLCSKIGFDVIYMEVSTVYHLYFYESLGFQFEDYSIIYEEIDVRNTPQVDGYEYDETTVFVGTAYPSTNGNKKFVLSAKRSDAPGIQETTDNTFYSKVYSITHYNDRSFDFNPFYGTIR